MYAIISLQNIINTMIEKTENNFLLYEFKKTLKNSLILVWIITGIILFFLTIMPLILSDELIFKLSSQVSHEHDQGRTCLLCGMTRGYILMSQCQLADAIDNNKYAPWLYGVSVVNGMGVFFYLGRLVRIYHKS